MTVELILGDCLEVMQTMADKSVDCVITDPPYLYLNHKLDRPFDEKVYFENVKRILKDDGFYVTFGRGESFYRWNCILLDMGFVFKEEIIWDKGRGGSPMTELQRRHETVSIFTLKNGKIKRSFIPYIEAKKADLALMASDIKGIKSALNNTRVFDEIQSFVEQYEKDSTAQYVGEMEARAKKHVISTASIGAKGINRGGARVRNVLQGMREVSIIQVPPDHRHMEHPTQKPVRLMERLMALVSSPDMVIFDPFMGSGTTGVACVQTGRNFIGCEIDPDYFKIAERRIAEAQLQPRLEFER